ncbi:MAG: hypothetical protein AAGA28_07055 [Pseudomonadota bacterium]
MSSIVFQYTASAAIALSLSATPTLADDTTPVTGEALSRLLSGNTAVGDWNDDQYRQYFDPSGATIYAVKGKQPSRGRWRVSDDGASYESLWNGPNWDAYEVVKTEAGHAWVTDSGTLYPFDMETGQQLTWPD